MARQTQTKTPTKKAIPVVLEDLQHPIDKVLGIPPAALAGSHIAIMQNCTVYGDNIIKHVGSTGSTGADTANITALLDIIREQTRTIERLTTQIVEITTKHNSK